MTGNLYIDLAISLGGIAFIVGVSYLLGAFRNPPITLERAVDRAAFDEPDFVAAHWLVDDLGRAAVGVSEEGEALIAFRVGDGVATRRIPVVALAATAQSDEIVVRLREPTIDAIHLKASPHKKAAEWVGRLGGKA